MTAGKDRKKKPARRAPSPPAGRTPPARDAGARPARRKPARAATTERPRADREPVMRITVARGDETFEFPDRLPMLPLRDVVVFPFMTIPLLVGRLPSINAIEKAVSRDRMLFSSRTW